MKKVRKIIAAIVTLAIVAISFAACGNTNTDSGSSEGESKAAASEAVNTSESSIASDNVNSEEPYEVVMTYVTIGYEPQDLPLVEQALSEYALEKINCTVKFKPVAISDLASQYNLWASSGEKVDLLMMFSMDIGSYLNEGKIISLEEYIDFMPAAKALDADTYLFQGGMYNNELYAIPVGGTALGHGASLYARTDLMENVEFEEKDIYTYEELDAIFAQVKEKYPELITIATAGVLTNTLTSNYIGFDDLGVSGGWAGVLMNPTKGDKTVVNLYESEEYYEFLSWRQKWNQAGYISQDAATTSDTANDWVKSGRCAGFLTAADTPGNKENVEGQCGYDMTQFNIKGTCVTTGSYNYLRWCVSTTSERPDKALEFLDLFYDGEEAINLIMNGIEGVHYVKNEGSMIISYPEGIDGTNTLFSNPLGIYGDKMNLYMFEPNEDSFYERSREYTEKALTITSSALGYSFVSDSYQNEIAAITSVMNRYLSSLEYGTVTDLEGTYQEFISALDAAGMNKLVEANQAQFDAWMAAQDN